MAITLAAPDEFASHYIADGTVKVQGFDVQTGWENGAEVYRSAFKDPAYDIIILPLSNFLVAMDQGMPLIGIPVFIDLFFPQIAIRVNKNAGITSPRDLEGKRVGVRGFAFNPAVWVRGGLADVYGVDLKKIQWVTADPNSLTGVNVPIAPGFSVESGADLVGDLETGKLDAVLWDRGGPAPTANTASVFEDSLAEALKYYRQSGVFPLNSMLLAKRSTIDANPGLGQSVVDASDAGRELYYQNVRDDDNHMGLPITWLREHGLFPHRNGVANNRMALEAIIRYAHEQGIISRRPEPEELFFDGAK
jgi:4,5-dihydroxyphthalate decarboxylase